MVDDIAVLDADGLYVGFRHHYEIAVARSRGKHLELRSYHIHRADHPWLLLGVLHKVRQPCGNESQFREENHFSTGDNAVADDFLCTFPRFHEYPGFHYFPLVCRWQSADNDLPASVGAASSGDFDLRHLMVRGCYQRLLSRYKPAHFAYRHSDVVLVIGHRAARQRSAVFQAYIRVEPVDANH